MMLTIMLFYNESEMIKKAMMMLMKTILIMIMRIR